MMKRKTECELQVRNRGEGGLSGQIFSHYLWRICGARKFCLCLVKCILQMAQPVGTFFSLNGREETRYLICNLQIA